MTINIVSVDVNCSNGVQLTVHGVAQVKVNADNEQMIDKAVENFLGLKEMAINNIITETMEGHQRGIISLMTVEEVFSNREEFSNRVRESATSDLMHLGVHLISYTMTSTDTSNGYLAALAKPTIAIVHRDARIGQAHANRDAEIAKAEAAEARDKKVFETKKAIESYTNDRNMQMQKNKKEINTVQAIAQNAERLKKAELNKELVDQQMQVKLIERQGEAKVMDEEMKLAEKRLQAGTLLNAETDKFKMETQAGADRTQTILKSEAKAIQIATIGEAEAEATKLKSEAEAKTTALKAQAYEQFGQAALVHEVIKTLPKIAKEITGPTKDMNKMTFVTAGRGEVGFKRVTDEVMKIMNEVPDGVHGITGIDLKGEIKRVMVA